MIRNERSLAIGRKRNTERLRADGQRLLGRVKILRIEDIRQSVHVICGDERSTIGRIWLGTDRIVFFSTTTVSTILSVTVSMT